MFKKIVIVSDASMPLKQLLTSTFIHSQDIVIKDAIKLPDLPFATSRSNSVAILFLPQNVMT